jgi:hypothetical protein
MNETFVDIGLGQELVAELASLGYEEPTPIQRAAIGPLLAGRDLLGQAATGTGKTAAFALPMLQRLGAERPAPGKPLALVLVPTRELAVQVSEAFHRYGRKLGTAVVPIYGGQEFHRQTTALRRGAHVVVATPGRALDHLRRGTLDLSDLRMVALDEADEMLDMGFAEDRDAAAAHRVDRGTAPARPRAHPDRARRREARLDAQGSAGGVHRAARAQGGGARARPRPRVADARARLLPHAAGRGRACRPPRGARLHRGIAPRRHVAGRARPRDGARAGRIRRPAGGD